MMMMYELDGDDPENQPQPKVRASGLRRNWEQHAARKRAKGQLDDWAAEIVNETAIVMPYAPSTAIRVLLLLVDFAEWTENQDTEFVGRELGKETLMCEHSLQR